MYGKLPEAEATGLTKSFTASEDGSEYTITVSREGIEPAGFTFKVNIPEGEAPEGGWPYIINYGGNVSGAQEAGYAVVEYSNYGDVASNDSYYNGVFYTMYPECKGDQYVKGVGPLAARAWGAGLIIDCIEAKTGRLGELDPAKSVVSGFSFLGKTTLVTGVLEDRIAVTNPQHSGIGGAAPFRYSSQGKYYSNEEYDMLNSYLITKTEPIGQVQGQGMAWVKTIFADFLGGDNTPFDTYMLLSLVAPRGLFVSSGYYDNGTDPEGMYASYLGARQVYDFLGHKDKIAFGNFETSLSAVHSVGDGEVEALLRFCDYYFYGKELPEGFYDTVYDESPDRAEYDVIRMPLNEDLIEQLESQQSQGAPEAKQSAGKLLEILLQMQSNNTLDRLDGDKKAQVNQLLAKSLLTISNEGGQETGIKAMTGGLMHQNFKQGDSFTLKASVADATQCPALDSKYDADSAVYLKLELHLNDNKVALSGPTTITVGAPAGIDRTKPIKVLHYADGSTTSEVLNVTVLDNGDIQFTTDSFSTFVIVNEMVKDTSESPSQESPSQESPSQESPSQESPSQSTEAPKTTESTPSTGVSQKPAPAKSETKEEQRAETSEEASVESSEEETVVSKPAADEKKETVKEEIASVESEESLEATEESVEDKADTTVLVNKAEPKDNSVLLIVIVIAAVVIITAAGAFYIIKKRKED